MVVVVVVVVVVVLVAVEIVLITIVIVTLIFSTGEPLQVGVSVQVRNLPKIDEEEGVSTYLAGHTWGDTPGGTHLLFPCTLSPHDHLLYTPVDCKGDTIRTC